MLTAHSSQLTAHSSHVGFVLKNLLKIFCVFVVLSVSLQIPSVVYGETENTTAPVLTILPSLTNIAPTSQSITLICSADDSFVYQWYKSNDGTINNGNAIDGETENSLILQPFIDEGIYYYYCGVKSADEDEIFSDIITVAHTGLPTVIIETENNINPTSAKEKRKGTMRIYYPNGDEYFSSNDFTIKVRGNATAGYPKKPYKLKLPKKINLLDIKSSDNKDKNWVLLANYCDKTLLRNQMGFYVASLFNEIDENEQLYVPHSCFVDVVLNSEYIGTYTLTDSVKEGEQRLNVNEKEKDFGGIGYVAEYDPNYYRNEPKWSETSMRKYKYTFKFPDTDETSFDIYMANFEKYMNRFEAAFYDYSDNPSDDWRKYIDLESFARWYLVHNILANIDTNYFFSKKNSDDDSKLVMGPVWDFEWSIGIGWYYDERPRNPDYWCVNGWYMKELLCNEEFVSEVKNQWKKLKAKYPDLTATINSKMKEYAQIINTSQEMNFKRWPILDQRVSVGGLPLGTYEAELSCDMAFIQNRISWLDSQIANLKHIVKIKSLSVDVIGNDTLETIFGAKTDSMYNARITAHYVNNTSKDITELSNMIWTVTSTPENAGISLEKGKLIVSDTTPAGEYSVNVKVTASIASVDVITGEGYKNIIIKITAPDVPEKTNEIIVKEQETEVTSPSKVNESISLPQNVIVNTPISTQNDTTSSTENMKNTSTTQQNAKITDTDVAKNNETKFTVDKNGNMIFNSAETDLSVIINSMTPEQIKSVKNVIIPDTMTTLSGLEKLTALEKLDLTNAKALTEVSLSGTSVTHVDMNKNESVKILDLSGSNVKTLNTENCSGLTMINLKNCSTVITLNAGNCEGLKTLSGLEDCRETLETLDVNGCSLLKLNLYGFNKLKNFNLSGQKRNGAVMKKRFSWQNFFSSDGWTSETNEENDDVDYPKLITITKASDTEGEILYHYNNNGEIEFERTPTEFTYEFDSQLPENTSSVLINSAFTSGVMDVTINGSKGENDEEDLVGSGGGCNAGLGILALCIAILMKHKQN